MSSSAGSRRRESFLHRLRRLRLTCCNIIVMSEKKDEVYHPSEEVKRKAHVGSLEEYGRLYKQSLDDPEAFWGDIAKQFYWKQQWTSPMSRHEIFFLSLQNFDALQCFRPLNNALLRLKILVITIILGHLCSSKVMTSTDSPASLVSLGRYYDRGGLNLPYRNWVSKLFLTLKFCFLWHC